VRAAVINLSCCGSLRVVPVGGADTGLYSYADLESVRGAILSYVGSAVRACSLTGHNVFECRESHVKYLCAVAFQALGMRRYLEYLGSRNAAVAADLDFEDMSLFDLRNSLFEFGSEENPLWEIPCSSHERREVMLKGFCPKSVALFRVFVALDCGVIVREISPSLPEDCPAECAKGLAG